MPGGMGGGADPQLAKSLQTWFILSILSIFCGCGCFGAVPIYLTYAGKQSVERGDVADAQSKLKIAKICVILGWVNLVIVIILNVVNLLLGGMSAFLQNM